MFKIFKPKGTLKENDTYKTKIELASSIVTELIEFGFKIELVLARKAMLCQSSKTTICASALRLYGEASSFIRTLEKYNLFWVLAIRSNHGVWLSSEQKVRANKWCKFKRTFSDQKAVRPTACEASKVLRSRTMARIVPFGERRKTKGLPACTRTKTSEIRYIREIIYGKRSYRTYWEVTTDPQTMPENSTYECDE